MNKIKYIGEWIWKNPDVGFGRPCIVNTGVKTGVIANRIKAGETIEDVAADYRLPVEAIRAACKYQRMTV